MTHDRVNSKRHSARWVPWLLFLMQLALTSVVVGLLSCVLVAQLMITPGAIFGEFDDPLTWIVSRGVDGVVLSVAAVFLFLATGLVVGLLGVPVRLIGPLRRAWLGHGEVSVGGVVLGLLTIAAAYLFGSWSSQTLEHGTYAYYTPAIVPLEVGWLLFAFSLSMFVWPARWMPRRLRSWWIETQATKHPVVS